MVVYRKESSDLDPITGTTADQLNEEVSNEGKKSTPNNSTTPMVPRAVLTSRPNSHPFHERHLVLDQPVKIGRSVARCRAGQNNAIFDCKVLSRNHALLWYENGKFYLQDTKSSNGTFVNNQRLSKGSEESLAREVCSGDIVQFGVDVVENSRKVVHGCVVATLRLFLPDGKESKASPTTVVVPPSSEASISSQDIYLLAQYLQEALHREQVLETKLGTLQKIVSNTQDESDGGWKALIEEDRLLSRIETLESQLQTCGKNVTDEKLRDDVLKLQEDKDKYQNAAKESMKKILQEKLEATQNLQSLENSLSNAESECAYLRETNKKNEEEMQYLLEKSCDTEKEAIELSKKLQEAEERYQDLVNQAAEEKMEIEEKLENMMKKEDSLSAKIESLEAENDISREQLESIKAHFEMFKSSHQSDGKLEKNGILSPCEDELESAEKDTAEKKKFMQELNAPVSRLELELQRVEDHPKNDVTLTFESNENYDRHANGDAKPSDSVKNLQAEIQQLKTERFENCSSIMCLLCSITILQELLSETRESKKIVDAELVELKSQYDENQNKLRKMQDEQISLQQQLDHSRQQLKDMSEEQEQNGLQSKMKSIESGELDEEMSEKEKGIECRRSPEVVELNNKLQAAQKEVEQTQAELAETRKQISELSEELKQKKLEQSSEVESLKSESTKLTLRIQVLESEVRKWENENIRLNADNKTLREMSAKLEAEKNALENTSDDYWKEKVHSAESQADQIRQQLSEALKEIVSIKEHFAKCTEEKTFLKKEKDGLEEQMKLVSVQSKASYACCVIPLVVLLIATMLAFYPALAHLTATSDQT